MLKKIIAVLLIFCLSLPVCALAQQDPKPIATYAPQDIPKTPEGVHHYLLLCADTWKCDINNMDNYTDGIMLVTVDTVAHRIMLTSFIRDMLVLRPDGKYGRINAVASRFGLQGLMDTINSHFGLEIDKYILVDWTDVGEIIDALGGVDIEIDQNEYLAIRSILLGKDPNMPDGPGLVHMTGRIALAYMRTRSTGSGGDFVRTERQRKVVSQLFDKCRDLSLMELVGLYNSVSSGMKMSLSAMDILSVLSQGYALMTSGADFAEYRIPQDGTYSYGQVGSSSVLDVRWKTNRTRFHALLDNEP